MRCGSPLLAHLYGPAARCKPKSDHLEKLVLRFCIRPIDGAFELLAIMDIRARSISFATRPRRPTGHLITNALATFLHLLFSTRRPRWESQLDNCWGTLRQSFPCERFRLPPS